MRSSLIGGCVALVLLASAQQAPACNGVGGRGARSLGAGLYSLGMAQMQMLAAQERYAAAQRAESHRKHVTTYTGLRDRELAEREARRQARLTGHNSPDSSAATAAPEYTKLEYRK
ncbi:MAG TPA: hypothetical protein VHC22_18850 [Pirellulales bacterium]|nr:hypothetical protein [Pirellulales bacterium]